MSDADVAFEDELVRFLPAVHRFAVALVRDAEHAGDLVQETYLRAFNARHTFRPGYGTRQWLFTICRNVFLRARERERWVVASLDDDADEEAGKSVALHIAARADGYEDIYDRIDFGPALDRAVATLTEPYRVAFTLVDIGGLSYAEAAEALQVPVGTLRSRLFRARRELQQQLIAYAHDLGIVPSRPEGA